MVIAETQEDAELARALAQSRGRCTPWRRGSTSSIATSISISINIVVRIVVNGLTLVVWSAGAAQGTSRSRPGRITRL